MPLEIPDLWADDIKVDVLPPLVILKAQDEAIRKKTQGMLRTDITTQHASDPDGQWVTHELDLVAPALGYRESLLSVIYRDGKYYPAIIRMPEKVDWGGAGNFSDTARCYSPDDFISDLRTALQADPTKGAITNLLALSYEARLREQEYTTGKPRE